MVKRDSTAQAWENWYKHRLEEGGTPGEIFFKRREFCLQFLASIKNKGHLRILDIGCGKGETIHEIKSSDRINSNSYEFYGVDITKEMLILAKRKSPKANFICADAFKLPFKDRSVDIVMCTDLLHHLTGKSRSKSKSNVERVLKEMVRICSNGYIIIMEENVKWIVSSYLVFLATNFASLLNIKLSYLGLQKGIVVSFFTPKEMYELFKKLGIEIIEFDKDEKKEKSIFNLVRDKLFLRTTWIKLIGRTHQK